MSVTDSILMTVYDRPWLTLFNTIHALRRQDLTDTEIIIVNDGSMDTETIARAKNYTSSYEMPVTWLDIDTVKDCPGTYNIDGYNNPAHAWNVGLDAAQGERITMLASDCIIPPHAMEHARACGRMIWMSCVMDMASASFFLGPPRIAPYGWFMTWRRDVVGEIRQDEALLAGMAFDDNDFTARLSLAADGIIIDPLVLTFHQSHPQVAYSDSMKGVNTNEAYIMAKWGGLPWSGTETDPLSIEQSLVDGCMILRVSKKFHEASALKEQHGFG